MSTNKKNLTSLITLFLFIISIIPLLSKEIGYDPITKSAQEIVDDSTSKENSYTLKFMSRNDVPKYVKVILTPKEGQATPFLCYSPTSPYCESDRRILVNRVDKQPAIAFVKMDEIPFFDNSKNLNVLVTCQQDHCGYSLDFLGADTCQLDASNGIVYSYTVTSSNTDMDFEALGIATEDTFINIGIEGSDKVNIGIESIQEIGEIFSINGTKAKFFSFQIKKDSGGKVASLAKFRIENALEGEYLNLNVYTTTNLNGLVSPENLLYPGGPAVIGAMFIKSVIHPQICLPVSAFSYEEFAKFTDCYLTARIYTKYALFWIQDNKGNIQEETMTGISDGLFAFIIEPRHEKKYICFQYYNDGNIVVQKDVLFSVQISPMVKGSSGFYNYFTQPMITGQNYRHLLLKGESLFFHSERLNVANKRYNFNIFNRKGATEMYVATCDNYPFCNFNMPDTSKMESVRYIGKMAIYDRPIEKTIEALDKNKRGILVTCIEDDNYSSRFCEFDISYIQRGEITTLIEGENSAKYILKGETGKIKIDLLNAFELKSVRVDIMIHTGEAIFEGAFSPDSSVEDTDQNSRIEKYILVNKVFFMFDLEALNVDYLFVTYKAIKNTFFTIKYSYQKPTDIAPMFMSYGKETIFANENYLVNIDPEIVMSSSNLYFLHFNNDRYMSGMPYLLNFFSINCEFKVTTNKLFKEEIEIPFADGYAQDILTSEEGQIYKNEYYNYSISIEKEEKSNYDKKMCMLYVTGFQTNSQSVLIGTNIPQRISFNDAFKKILYLYPLSDTDVDYFIFAKVITKANYSIEIFIDNETNLITSELISKSTPINIDKSQYMKYCPSDSFCNLMISVELFDCIIPNFYEHNSRIEIILKEKTFKQGSTYKRVPYYIQKNIAKTDLTMGDGLFFLYTDLGESDQGYITFNFYGKFADVYGRIVQKDKKDLYDVEWMEMYRLPSPEYEEDDDHYDKSLNRYYIKNEDTEECINGCYLILGISIYDEYTNNGDFYYFDIMSRIDYNSFPDIINIQVDQCIIGNLDISSKNRIILFYQVSLPYDAQQIQIDFQSDLARLYINIDGKLPTLTEADFIFIPNNESNVLLLEQTKIFNKAKEKGILLPYEYSLEDVKLIIGIWADKTDTADKELYSLRIHEVKIENYLYLDVINLKTNQKILCKTSHIGDEKYHCIFMLTYDEQELTKNKDLLFYTRSTKRSNPMEFYADFIDSKIFDQFDLDKLRRHLPGDNAEFNSLRDDLTYLHIKLNEIMKNKYLYINVITSAPDEIMVISSLNSYLYSDENKYIFYPSIYTQSLALIKGDFLIIDFQLSNTLYVNIESLEGNAEIIWEEDPSIIYYLQRKGDQLTLTTSNNYKKLYFKKLGTNSEFVFLLSFYSRKTNANFDKVELCFSNDIGYINTDFPLYLYATRFNMDKDINIAMNLNDFDKKLEGEYENSPLEVRAYLEKRENIYFIKENPVFFPSDKYKIPGVYDPCINIGYVWLNNIKMNQLDIKPEDHPTLLLYTGKSSKAKDLQINKIFNIEMQFTQINDLIIPNENVYIYGKYWGKLIQYYKLKTDKTKPYMKIILAFNGDSLTWAVGHQNSNYNDTSIILNTLEERGKKIITIKSENDFIYLNIFKKEYYEEQNYSLQNYVFKYINIASEEDFIDYKIKDNNATIKCEEDKYNIKFSISCTFNKIDIDTNNTNVFYYLKIANEQNYIKGESFNTIALTESSVHSKYVRNPIDNKGKITLSIETNFRHWYYLQIIARIQEKNMIEYVAYNSFELQLFDDEINIKQEDNNIRQIIGKEGTFEIKTDFIDREDIYYRKDIEKHIFVMEMKNKDNDRLYYPECRLWIPKKEKMRIFCKLNTFILYSSQKIILYDKLFNYENFFIAIKTNNIEVELEYIDENIPFLYSELQTIYVRNKEDIYEMRFNIESYNNEKLILFSNETNNYVLGNNKIIDGELICTIPKTKIKEILQFDGQMYYVGVLNDLKKIIPLNSITGVQIYYDKIQTEDIYIQITRLLNNIVATSEFVAYETNITSISNIITGPVQMKYNNTNSMCYLKKNEISNLMLLCLIKQKGTYRLGKITERIVFKNIQYNFILENAENYEEVSVVANGGNITAYYPYELDFTLNDKNIFIIEYIMTSPNISKGLKLFEDAEELECEDLKFIKRCLINLDYFAEKKSGYYYTYHINHLNTYSIFYEVSPIKVFLPFDTISINIKYEDNKKIKDIGNKGILVIETDYDDTERNIFNTLVEEEYTFNNTMTDESDNIYTVQCRFWKIKEKVQIFCRFSQDLSYTTHNLTFSSIDYEYKNYTIRILNHCNIIINQIKASIPFIYSDIQNVNLDQGDISSIKFKYDIYSNEDIFLFDNKFKSVYFEKCSIEAKAHELTCQISNKKIKSIATYSGEKFNLATFSKIKGQYILETVGDIIVQSNQVKNDHVVKITKLMNPIAEINSFIYYETNITNIPEFTSSIFNIPFNSSNINCMFKKRAQNEHLMFLCHAKAIGNYSIGEIQENMLYNISLENNLLITPLYNYETCSVDRQGGLISTVNPQILDFTKQDSFIIKIGLYGNLKGIKLNPDSKDYLSCEKYINYLECIIHKSHFDNKENGYYNIYYENRLNESYIKYEAPLIHVILPNKNNNEDNKDNKDGDGDNTTLIVVCVCVPLGVIIIGLVIFLVLRKKKNEVDIKDLDDINIGIPLTET